MPNQGEAFSRVVIDRKLRESGWDIEDSRQVVFEDHSSAGRADYILKDDVGKPLALIEAKAPGIDPYSAKEQALNYVKTQYKDIDYIFLANDNIIYFWDLGNSDAVPVPAFFSLEDLIRKRRGGRVGNVEPLSRHKVESDYFINEDPAIKLRPYQIKAWDSIAESYDKGKRSFLLEMATGTGKTTLAAMIISKFLRTQQAETILFIVDRKQLATQAKQEFERLLGNLSAVGTYWGSYKRNLTGSNVVIATIQSLALNGTKDFSPGYFDLIFHDEAHRSIYSPEARAAVDHFIGATKIGLTATPKDFLRNIDKDKLAVNDPRSLEKRVQRDTYKYFGCEDGKATFRYNIQDAVDDGWLVKPRYHKMNTILTQSALSEEGLVLEDAELENESFRIKDLEKKVYLPKRNRAMMEEFLAYGDKTPDGKFGKTIIFAVSQKHALKLEQILNELRPEFNGKFAKTVTSWVKEAHDIAKEFKKIDSDLPRVVITVDMLSTGYDAPPVQNIVLSRPIFEPTTYIQIKGRGTRLCEAIRKDHFTIYDFCGVVEYFEEKYDWEAPLTIPKNKKEGGYSPSPGPSPGPEPGLPRPVEEIPTSQQPDMVSSRNLIYVIPDGDPVDRHMYQTRWAEEVNKFVDRHPEIKVMVDDPDRTDDLIDLINRELLNRPDFYFNEDSLIQSHRVIAGVRDFFLSALGKEKLPNRSDQLQEFKLGLISKFGTEDKGGSQRKTLMVEFFADQVTEDEDLRNQLLNNPRLDFLRQESFTHAYPVKDWLDTFGREGLEDLVLDVNQSKLLRV